MKKAVYVGFDTSNYTTSAAVCSEAGEILANIRILLPVKPGERGLRQSEALFYHNRNLPAVCEELQRALCGLEVRAVGCSVSPRSEEGSYMPCFLAGRAAAGAFAAARDLELRTCSHQDGHIMAALYSSGGLSLLESNGFAAFHVSGGTTEVLLVKPRQCGFDVTCIGGTADLHAGQAIDRVGVLMGLQFPCGKAIEALAAENTKPVPKPKISVKDGSCHFSGLENLAGKLWRETEDRALVSAFVLAYCAETLKALTVFVDQSYPDIPVVYAGGVMSNRYLQGELAKRGNCYFAAPEFSADNASGVALLCRRAAMAEKTVLEDE